MLMLWQAVQIISPSFDVSLFSINKVNFAIGFLKFFFFKLSTPRLVPTLMFTIEITNLDSDKW